MRRFTLSGVFLILAVGLYFLWQCRFERVPGISTLTLNDIRQTAKLTPGVDWLGGPSDSQLRLRVIQGHPPTVTRFDLPGFQETDRLHLKFAISANKLRPGREDWEDGRGIIEWHSPRGQADSENDPFGAARHDQTGLLTELVAKPEEPTAIPALRLENLGTSGDLILSRFEATLVRERMVWKIGHWVLLAGWFVWVFLWINYRGSHRLLRPMLASTVWILMGIYFVVPGPWKSFRSFGPPFCMGDAEFHKIHSTAPGIIEPEKTFSVPDGVPPETVLSVGQIPEKGDIALRIKHYAQKARPFLHLALLFGPTFLAACLVGRRSTLSLAVVTSIAIELAQVAFGFGFDLQDVVDLLCDATGIALALAIHHLFLRRWSRLVAS